MAIETPNNNKLIQTEISNSAIEEKLVVMVLISTEIRSVKRDEMVIVKGGN